MTISDISSIIIEPVYELDSGNYTCVASSEGKTDLNVATLNVYGKMLKILLHFTN